MNTKENIISVLRGLQDRLQKPFYSLLFLSVFTFEFHVKIFRAFLVFIRKVILTLLLENLQLNI